MRGSLHWALAALILCCSSALASPVAMVTDLSGSVSLYDAGKTQPAALLASLEPATTLRLGAGARVVLTFFAKAVEVTLSGPAEATLGAEGVTVQKGTAPVVRNLESARADAARKFQSAQRERVTLATVQMRSIVRPQITIEGPSNTAVYSVSPVLAWSGPQDMDSYRLVLTDAQGRNVLERTVTGTSFALSDIRLAPGASYAWRLEARLGSGESLSARAAFSVLDAERGARIAAAKPAAGAAFSERLLFAAQLESEGLHYEAKREWRALAAERPEDASLRQWAR